MAEQPKWTELIAKYVKSGRLKIVGIVLHDTAGNGGHGDTKYLAHPTDGRRVSVDFTVERDGGIWKLNPDLEKFRAFPPFPYQFDKQEIQYLGHSPEEFVQMGAALGGENHGFSSGRVLWPSTLPSTVRGESSSFQSR